jgi:hypothetical protein
MKTRNLWQLLPGLVTSIALLSTCEFEREIKVRTGEVVQVSENSVVLYGEIVDAGEDGIQQYGHCWSTTTYPDNNSLSHYGATKKPVTFNTELSSLEYSTGYYYWAYCSDGIRTIYGEMKSFTTGTAPLPEIVLDSIGEITYYSAKCFAGIIHEGSPAITSRGICWGTHDNPAIEDNYTVNGNGAGLFTVVLTGLESNTQYYVRGYCTNTNGTYYSTSSLEFTTKDIPQLSVITDSVNLVTDHSAKVYGTVISDGGSTVTQRGVCYDINPGPTLNDPYTINGTGIGSFSAYVSGLEAATTYYARTYAINSSKTVYGNEFEFATLDTGYIFYDDFSSFSNWHPSSNNSNGCLWTASNGFAQVASMGYASGNWVYALYETNLPVSIPPGTDFSFKARIIVMDGDPAGTLSGTGVVLLDDNNDEMATLGHNDSQASSGYGGIHIHCENGYVFNSDPDGFSTSNPEFSGVLEIRRVGNTWSAYIDGIFKGSLTGGSITGTATKIRIHNGRYSNYGYRDGKIDFIILSVL